MQDETRNFQIFHKNKEEKIFFSVLSENLESWNKNVYYKKGLKRAVGNYKYGSSDEKNQKG